MIGPDTAWEHLSEGFSVRVSPGIARCGALNSELPAMWSTVASRSDATGRASLGRASTSTHLAVGPGSAPEVIDRFARKMREEGATLHAPILPAGSGSEPRHTLYRRWFTHAEQLDAGGLGAVAFVNVGQAVSNAATMSGAPRVGFNSATGDVMVVGNGGRHVFFSAEPLAFMAIMKGALPEELLAATIEEARRQARRADWLASAAADGSDSQLRFAGDLPVHWIADSLIADPVGGAHVAGEPLPFDWHDRLRAAVRGRESPACTCAGRRRVQAVLRSARSTGGSARADHSFAFEVRCAHAARRVQARQRADTERWRRAWLADPVDGPLIVTGLRRFGYAASLVHGEEIGAFAACPELLDELCTALDFPVDAEVVACVPTANVLLLSDEPVDVVRKVLAARSVWASTVDVYVDPRLGPGAKVGCITSIVVNGVERRHGLRDRLQQFVS